MQIGKSDLDRAIDSQVMTVARLARHGEPTPELRAARQHLAGLVLRRHVTRALAKAGELTDLQRAEIAAEIWRPAGATPGVAA